ncbi:MAG: polysaccharide deacetylase family protein [Gammaproteobacteria bacterium]|nr:polysaccharide deacetylase family protein [Gammaproteobacteria bacterium]MBQ0838663.1 polysaccharide deacetylase family protein [Gammaproteobacteria bacterium]
MQTIKDKGFEPVSLKQVGLAMSGKAALPRNAIAITIDDGLEDNYTNAFAIMSEFNIPATIFLTTGYMGGQNSWMQGEGFPSRPMLNWTQVKEMARHGIAFGAHSVNHPRLSTLQKTAAHAEIYDSKQEIEEQLGSACEHFAYPYGDFIEQTTELVKEAGFTLGCSTRSGFNNNERSPFALHRIEVYGTDPKWKLKQKITFGHNDASLFFPVKYYVDRLTDRS